MIKRSILVCTAVILAWHLVMPRLPRSFYTIPGMQRANYLHAQNFVHDTPAGARVIVGSSMSDRLSEVVLGRDHVKLTFPAGGPFTGLEIIRATGRRPPVLWIESNVIVRDAEADLLADVLSPWRRKLRDASPVFMEQGRPSEYGVGFLKAVVKKAGRIITGDASKAAVEPVLDHSVLDGIMAENRENLSKVPEPVDLAKRVDRMAAFVDEISRAGCKVIFYEMPIDASLEDFAVPVTIRKAMRDRFPPGKYHWLDLGRDIPYRTIDGIHLAQDDADAVARKMLDFEKGLD